MKYPPLDPGTEVRTLVCATRIADWSVEAWKSRGWGLAGTIVKHHDSHGLCYEVRHEDGTVGYYDPAELEVLSGRQVAD